MESTAPMHFYSPPAVITAPSDTQPTPSTACSATTRGVDSTAAAHEALQAGKALAREHGCVVAISGAEDLVRGAGGLLHRCACRKGERAA